MKIDQKKVVLLKKKGKMKDPEKRSTLKDKINAK
jgi:hypothetical protein